MKRSLGLDGADSGKSIAWTYDSFGNRLTQTPSSGSPFPTEWAYYGASNRMAVPSGGGMSSSQGTLTYNGPGVVTNDGVNSYTLDSEDRVCNDVNSVTGQPWTNIYDVEGNRVAKGTVSAGKTCFPNNFAATETTIIGSGGEQATVLGPGTTWAHTNVFAGGELLATYDSAGLHFAFNDWLGTKRVQASPTGAVEGSWQSLPFGDGLVPMTEGATDQHYTGKLHDLESQLDDFGARFYEGTLGRFLSPDPAGMQAVDLEFPQSLNRYAYVWNNPLSFTDPTGLDCAYLNSGGNGLESFDQSSSSGECGRTGGYWVNGGLTNINVNADQGSVQLTGTTNGDDQTHASYQDTQVNVGEYWNGGVVPHTAFGLNGQTPMGLIPTSQSQFITNKFDPTTHGGVPGKVVPQVGGQLLNMAHVPVTGMQAQMIQNSLNQAVQNPPNYDIYGTGPSCDCASFTQRILGDAGINTGPATQKPWVLQNNLQNLYPQPQ